MKDRIQLVPAVADNIPALVELVNQSYRGTSGWTTEHGMIDGLRVTTTHIQQLLAEPDSSVLVYHDQLAIRACIHLKHSGETVYIGMFAVHPNLQKQGVGHRVLQQAEQFAQQHYNCKRLAMYVVQQRPELLAYYQRRGYQSTGISEAFPEHLDVGTPQIENLGIDLIEKIVS